MANKNMFNGRKKVNPALAAMNRQQHDILLIRSSNKANLLLSLMVLHSKFGFTKDELNHFLSEYRKQLDAYNSGYVENSKDFEDVLWDECEIRIDL